MLFFTTDTLHAITVIDIPPGDTDSFIQAVNSASKSQDTWLIRLASNSEYSFNLTENVPEPISGHLIIHGENAHFVSGGDQGFGQILEVADSAVLELSNLIFRSFDSGENFPALNRFGLIQIQDEGVLMGKDLRFENIRVHLSDGVQGAVITNHGNLLLDRVRISNISVGPTMGIALWNSGTARLQNLLIADSIQENPNDSGVGRSYLFNFGNGRIDILYSTLIARSDLSESEQIIFALGHGGGLGIQPKTTTLGSMFVGLECPNEGVSRGFNLFDSEDCVIGGKRDLVGVKPTPLSVTDQNGLEIIPLLGSPALEGVRSAKFFCPALDVVHTDRPQDGNGNGKARCDIGAFEAMEATPLFAGGESGLFYDSAFDGHYISIIEVRPQEYVVTWNAFDLDGNQSWVLAVGILEGDTITGNAFFLPEGHLIPGNGAQVNTDNLQDWGTMSIQFLDCNSGTFEYDSLLSQFGYGSFPLERIAYVNNIGCHDN